MKSSWACAAWRRRGGEEDDGSRGRWNATGSGVDRELTLGSIDGCTASVVVQLGVGGWGRDASLVLLTPATRQLWSAVSK